MKITNSPLSVNFRPLAGEKPSLPAPERTQDEFRAAQREQDAFVDRRISWGMPLVLGVAGAATALSPTVTAVGAGVLGAGVIGSQLYEMKKEGWVGVTEHDILALTLSVGSLAFGVALAGTGAAWAGQHIHAALPFLSAPVASAVVGGAVGAGLAGLTRAMNPR